jgi:hypothetical protein
VEASPALKIGCGPTGKKVAVDLSTGLYGSLRAYGPPALALYLLASSRWGSYVLPGPPYIADLLLAVLLINGILSSLNRERHISWRETSMAILGGATLAWCSIEFLLGSLSQDSLRDAAPYFYVVIIFLTVPLADDQEKYLSRLITAALVFHAAWTTLTLLAGHLSFEPSLGAPAEGSDSLYVFAIRGDVDMLSSGLLAVISLHRALLGRRPLLNVALMVWGTSLVVAMNSRAGLLTFAAQVVLIMLLAPARNRQRFTTAASATYRSSANASKASLAVAAIICLIPFALYTAPSSAAIGRATAWLSGNTGVWTGSGSDPSATSTARFRTWSHLAKWLADNRSRSMFGVGFGPNYMLETGDVALLVGNNNRTDVRSPHSFEMNTWARLGAVGLAIILALAIAGYFLVARIVIAAYRSRGHIRDTDLLALLVAASAPIAGTLGVVLESPFGALPYFWSLGHLSVRVCQLGLAPRFADVLRSQPRSRPRYP